MTRTERMTGVSRLVRRPRSCSTFAMTPDDETQVMPASATAATGPQPRISAIRAPGAALRAMSRRPAVRDLLRLPTSSGRVYSRPSISSSRITPISAPIAMNSSPA